MATTHADVTPGKTPKPPDELAQKVRLEQQRGLSEQAGRLLREAGPGALAGLAGPAGIAAIAGVRGGEEVAKYFGSLELTDENPRK